MRTPVARPAGGKEGDAEGRAVAAARNASGLTQRELSRQAMISLLALAVESDDIGRAVKLSAQWQPAHALPAERRSHFHIETARAHCWAGHRDQAVTALWQARQAAPQHTRCNPAASETVTTLMRGSRTPSPHLIQFANWMGLINSSLVPGRRPQLR